MYEGKVDEENVKGVILNGLPKFLKMRLNKRAPGLQRRPSCLNLEPARARPPELGQLGSALRISGKEL